MKTRVLTVLSLVALVFVVAIGAVSAAERVRVGATPVPHAEILEFIKPAMAERGYELEVVEFTDYVQPNLALNDGDLDANFFQHIPYLEDFAASHRLNITYNAKIHIEPMGAYTKQLQSIDDLKSGSTIAIPNDAVNGGRALLLLQSKGLIKLDPAAGITATVFDIVDNPLRLRFVELEAPQLPRSLDDVALAIINTNFALEANLVPTEDALFIEDSQSPYVNVIAVRQGDDREGIRVLAEVLQSDAVREFILNNYDGAVVPAF
ncbi:MAG: MetQ/NlpA family ABC transporter substrate-binding protein [Firmicutes bacterium]|nr:MetQ/NlpA family ABC transporter substrate-binding protein [Bacillota bacterium]